jgi:O-antigen ligase
MADKLEEPSTAARMLASFIPVAAWATYAPLGIKYLAFLLCLLLSAAALRTHPPAVPLWRPLGARMWLALFALLALSSLWSPAAWSHKGSHIWLYGLPLGVLPIAAACPPAAARRALQQFVVASALIGMVSALHALGALPDSNLWSSTVLAIGNQRIVTSLLLALGAALALWLTSQAEGTPQRLYWLLAAAMATLGLSSQDRRTGMLMLPLLLMAWALGSRQKLSFKTAMVATVVVAALATWTGSAMVRARFDEGLNELRTYQSSDTAATSWGQRVRMFERTTEMVRESPLIGHGLGSWQQLWDARIAPDTMLAHNSTPHNEYLLVAEQAGVPTALVFLLTLVACLAAAIRAGPLGMPALMVWLALALAGLANAVLRDAKFSLPLLLLAALAQALYRPAEQPRDAADRP